MGSSSRDIRLRTNIELPRAPIHQALTAWSTLEEWYEHPVVGPRLIALIDERGGVRGRAGDLLSDPVGRKAILEMLLKGLMQFPGFPIEEGDVEQLLANAKG